MGFSFQVKRLRVLVVLPVGTAGKGMMMMSGGIDSPVAAYLGMKRGVSMEMVHFFSPPYILVPKL